MAKKAPTPHPETCGEVCPYRYAEHGCPYYVRPSLGLAETNVVTGEERLVQGCFFQVIPGLMKHVIVAANRGAASAQSMRNEVVQGLAVIGNTFMDKFSSLKALAPEKGTEPIAVEFQEVRDGEEN